MTFVVSAGTVLGMANNSTLNWMGSIEPVRRLIRETNSGCASCGNKWKQPQLTQALYLYIANSGAFKSDMLELKVRNNYDAVQVLTDTGSFTV